MGLKGLCKEKREKREDLCILWGGRQASLNVFVHCCVARNKETVILL